MSELLSRPPAGPLTFTVDMSVRPDQVELYRQELGAAVRLVREESACLEIHALEAGDQAGRFLMFERWSDGLTFYDEVRSRAYFRSYKAATARLHQRPPVLNVWVPIQAPGREAT